MKEELEKLGFIPIGINSFILNINTYLSIEVCNKDEVWLNNINVDTIYLFPYNHEKLKQLIQLLS